MTSLLASEDHMWLKQHLDFALLLLGCAAFPLAKTNLDGLQMPCAAWMLWGLIQSPLETLTALLSGLRGKCSLSLACVLFRKGGSPKKRLQNNNACLENKPLASWLTKVKAVEVFVDERVCVCSRKRRLRCKVKLRGIPPKLSSPVVWLVEVEVGLFDLVWFCRIHFHQRMPLCCGRFGRKSEKEKKKKRKITRGCLKLTHN